MTVDTIIDGIVEREGGYVDHPSDKGGPTKFGITATTLGEWRQLHRPATREEVRHLSVAEARQIYHLRYVRNPGFERIPFEPLRAQLCDFAVNSGPARAIRWLQRVLQAPETGVLDAATLAELGRHDGRLVNDALVAGRLYMVDRWTDADRSQKVFEEGVESRALEFFLSRPVVLPEAPV